MCDGESVCERCTSTEYLGNGEWQCSDGCPLDVERSMRRNKI